MVSRHVFPDGTPATLETIVMSALPRFIRFAALALVAGAPLLAQQATGALKGRVADAKGNPKAGVIVTITNPRTAFVRSGATDASGLFAFVALPLGEYQITYAQGGQTFRSRATVVLGQDTFANFLKWPAAQAGATVEILATSAQAEAIDTSSAQMGTTVGQDVITSLPIVSRDINQAALLAPGVQIVSGSQVDPTKKAFSYITTGDGMGRGTSFAVDGADNNSTDVGGYVLSVPIDAIAEFQVVTNQYKAEFGRSTAGFFNVVTKSGSNEFTGLLSAQYTNQSMRARVTDEGTKNDNTKGSYAFTVTGPILKDKLFYMVSAERQQSTDASFPFQPYALSLYPELAGTRQEGLKRTVYAKVDWNISQESNLSLNYGTSQNRIAHQGFPRTTSFAGNIPPSALGTDRDLTWAAGARWTWNISSNLVLESHYSYFSYANSIAPDSQGPPGNGSPAAVMDYVNSGSYSAVIPAPFPGHRTDSENWGWGGIDPNALQNTGIKRGQWKNELTWITGSHTIKGGLDYQRTSYADQQLFFGETGIYRMVVEGVDPVTGQVINYKTGWNSTVSANQNVVAVAFVANGLQKGIDYKQYGVYLQDDWTISPKWSVYFGARLDWDTQLDYLKDRYSDIYSYIHQYNPILSGMDGNAPTGKKYFEPRVQALYRPYGDDKLVFKFGAGRFVAQVIDNVTGFSRGLSNLANGLPIRARNSAAFAYNHITPYSSGNVTNFSAGSTIGQVNGHAIVLPADLTPYNYANNVGGLRDYFRNTVDGWLSTATPETGGKSLLSSDFQYPTTDAFNVGFAYRFNERSGVDVTLVYSKSRHLTTQLAGPDGSSPNLVEVDADGNDMGDTIFFSNQTASMKQLQAKYSYADSNNSFIFSITFKEAKASEGGAGGAFDASGSTGGLYGEGAQYNWKTSSERISAGTDRLEGSFSYSHRFDFGTMISFLGSWHSGKAYDVTQQYNNELGVDGGSDQSHPIEYLGTEYGRWNLDISAKVSHRFKLTKALTIEPYLAIQNLLNNYDYGSNYDGIKINSDGSPNTSTSLFSGFGKRGQAFQANQPRNYAIGARVTF